jgi:hypothetical protein
VIIAIGNTTLRISDNFEISGIALGTIVTVAAFHLVRLIAPPHLREDQARERADAPPKDRDGPQGTAIIIDEPGAYKEP